MSRQKNQKKEKAAKSFTSKRNSPSPRKDRGGALLDGPVIKSTPAETTVTPPISAKASSNPNEASRDSHNAQRAAELIAQLRDTSAETARDAALELGTLGNTVATPALIETLENREGYFHLVVRCAAAASLGRLRDARAVDALVATLRDTMAEISAESALALGQIRDERAVAPLIDVLRNTDWYFASPSRRAAATALGSFANTDARSALSIIADNAMDDQSIRQAAIDALASGR